MICLVCSVIIDPEMAIPTSKFNRLVTPFKRLPICSNNLIFFDWFSLTRYCVDLFNKFGRIDH